MFRLGRAVSRQCNPPCPKLGPMSDIPAISPSPIPIANEAIKNSLANVARDAHVIANAPSVDSADTLQALVDAKQQVLYTKAAARIISTTDRMVKSLLDTQA